MVDNYLWSPSDLNTNFKEYIRYLKNKKLHINQFFYLGHSKSIELKLNKLKKKN